jgi:UTP--glucose-1-phosphate uridylyltransferase
MSQLNHFVEFEQKMGKAGIKQAAIQAFQSSYQKLVEGQTGLIPETEIQPVANLPRLEGIDAPEEEALLKETVVIKLNGGLGTSMGLESPKSLLEVKDGLTFLDFIARQILFLRKRFQQPLRFLLMNSFNTSEQTLEFLRRYPELGTPKDLELMQGLVPKVEAASLRPISWPANSQLEWCPPGHGDIYPSLVGSGWLDRLLSEGVRFAFVSNSDNLGASLDLRLLSYFAQSKKSFIMEVTERTEADKKGGHLARYGNGRFLLRESAQCPEADLNSFQDIQRHRFFNTNNLWLRLDHLKEILARNGGIVPLPLIKNTKTVDPRDKKSAAVFQLETAMGAAIESFDNSGAVNVPRSRFAPVKNTSDLLTLRSDACNIAEDWRITLSLELNGRPPTIDLDGDFYKLMDEFDARFRAVPSLKRCARLKVRGPVDFGDGIAFAGNVEVTNAQKLPKPLKAGVYENQTVVVGQ